MHRQYPVLYCVDSHFGPKGQQFIVFSEKTAVPQSLARIWLHITFSTNGRRAYLQNPQVREEMFRMLSHHAQEVNCPPARSGGWIDHVHILCGLSRTITIAKLVEHLKVETSKWVKGRAPDLATFHWQAGYGAVLGKSILGRECHRIY